jgi:hypothetical protein
MLDAPDVQTVPVRQFGRGNGFSNSLKAADLADLADFIDLSSLAKRTPQRKNKFGDVERVAGPSLDPASERTYHNTSTRRPCPVAAKRCGRPSGHGPQVLPPTVGFPLSYNVSAN